MNNENLSNALKRRFAGFAGYDLNLLPNYNQADVNHESNKLFSIDNGLRYPDSYQDEKIDKG